MKSLDIVDLFKKNFKLCNQRRGVLIEVWRRVEEIKRLEFVGVSIFKTILVSINYSNHVNQFRHIVIS